MKEWFAQFNQREQTLLLSGAACVVLYLLYVLVWSPVTGMRADMAQRNLVTLEALGRVQTMAAELKQLQGGGSATAQKRNLNQLINNSTAEYKLRPSRIQPNSRGEMQVRFEDAQLADLLRWIHQLELGEGLVIVDASIVQGERGGLVNANIRLGQGS